MRTPLHCLVRRPRVRRPTPTGASLRKGPRCPPFKPGGFWEGDAPAEPHIASSRDPPTARLEPRPPVCSQPGGVVKEFLDVVNAARTFLCRKVPHDGFVSGLLIGHDIVLFAPDGVLHFSHFLLFPLRKSSHTIGS